MMGAWEEDIGGDSYWVLWLNLCTWAPQLPILRSSDVMEGKSMSSAVRETRTLNDHFVNLIPGC